MKNWKQAYFLTKFEMSRSKRAFLFLFVFTGLITLGILSSTEGYLEKNYVGLDLIFIIMFTVGPVWAKPKHFQIQQMNTNLIASPAVIMLNQLPINKDIIVKSRFIIHFIYTLPVQVILLSCLYLFIPMIQNIMSVGTYLIFSIIWISFSLYAGSIFPASDAGDKASSLKVIIYGILMVVGAIMFFTLFQLVSNRGIVAWTIYLAQQWPILSASISIILSIIGLKYWQHYMKKTMDKLDYL